MSEVIVSGNFLCNSNDNYCLSFSTQVQADKWLKNNEKFFKVNKSQELRGQTKNCAILDEYTFEEKDKLQEEINFAIDGQEGSRNITFQIQSYYSQLELEDWALKLIKNVAIIPDTCKIIPQEKA